MRLRIDGTRHEPLHMTVLIQKAFPMVEKEKPDIKRLFHKEAPIPPAEIALGVAGESGFLVLGFKTFKRMLKTESKTEG